VPVHSVSGNDVILKSAFNIPVGAEANLDPTRPAIRDQLCRIGRDLFWMGLQSPRSGNLSAMLEDGRSFVITRRGSSLRMLDPQHDLVVVEFDRPMPAEASSEGLVHQAIYRATKHRAVVHAHPPYAIALSFSTMTISPMHNEGRVILGDVPITTSNALEGEGEDPAPIATALKNASAMVVRGHGAFAAGADCESAFYHMGLLEASAKIVYLTHFTRPE
jgi:L-fuculose-phosphate aldolase